MSELLGNQKKQSGNVRQLPKERIDKANPHCNLTAEDTNLYFPNQDTNRKFEKESFTHFIGNFFHKDLNNDGFKDLILRVWWDENGYFENSSTESFPFIFMNHNNEKYLPIPFSSGNNFKLLHSLSAGDFNGDGVMDIIGIDPSNGSKVYTYYFNNF